jgi:hypothetical protein
MTHIEQELRGVSQRTLVAQTSGLARFAPARALYHKRGYAQRGRVPDYWGSGDDLVPFSKALGVPTGDPARVSKVRIVTVDVADLDALKPLWLQLHYHHQASLPTFAGFVTDDERSWRAPGGLYRRVLGARQGFVLAAEQDERTVGYAAVELLEGADATLAVGPRFGQTPAFAVRRCSDGRSPSL